MGSGFRTFTAGEVLTASNVQNYLMDQSVMVFGGSAARSSAIGTANFEEGMVSYLTDTDKVEAYNGTDWVSVAPTSSQGLTLINTTSFSGVTSVSVNDVFSATYDNYRILITGTGLAGGELDMRYRLAGSDNSTASSYFTQLFEGINTTPFATRTNTTSQRIGSLRQTAPSAITVEVFNPFKVEQTAYHSFGVFFDVNDYVAAYRTGRHNQTVSYDGFTIFQGSNIAGTIRVYGYTN